MSKPTHALDREAKRRLAIIRHVEEVTGNVALTCRYYGISRQAYYVWYRRYLAEGVDGLRTRSKRPKTCPHATRADTRAGSCSGSGLAGLPGGRFRCGATRLPERA